MNGEERVVAAPLSLDALLEEMGVDRRGVAVARGRDVVPRGEYETTMLEEGDVLEIVRMVGGG